ncbi:MAG: N-acetyl-1-D-myo-inositol-2-amino-2-deoxy-alpha-D-glucopyranoside deacetylase [Chloroflexi bacterium]|nr:N-acetyl-1-D-myo-inositol-2-amino-2-deoxy-alpha-D-glucopyranoside deacetylase [Chloroflexota bacterium]
MAEQRLLAVYGHPDDEGQAAGTLAAALAAGVRVTLLCATRGEVGEISDAALATPKTLGYVRELELRAAMAQIGLGDVRFLPYRDSGMEGTPPNDDPRCLHRAPAEAVVGELVGLLRELRPHVVLTWDAEGGYGHPDHLAVHRHVTAAFDAAGDAARYPDRGAPWAPARLYWGARPMKRWAGVFAELERRGLIGADELNPAFRERAEAALRAPDPPVSLQLDVRAHLDAKRRAARMHRTQFGEGSLFARIPPELEAEFFGDELFYRARPAWPDGAAPERVLWPSEE